MLLQVMLLPLTLVDASHKVGDFVEYYTESPGNGKLHFSEHPHDFSLLERGEIIEQEGDKYRIERRTSTGKQTDTVPYNMVRTQTPEKIHEHAPLEYNPIKMESLEEILRAAQDDPTRSISQRLDRAQSPKA